MYPSESASLGESQQQFYHSCLCVAPFFLFLLQCTQRRRGLTRMVVTGLFFRRAPFFNRGFLSRGVRRPTQPFLYCGARLPLVFESLLQSVGSCRLGSRVSKGAFQTGSQTGHFRVRVRCGVAFLDIESLDNRGRRLDVSGLFPGRSGVPVTPSWDRLIAADAVLRDGSDTAAFFAPCV